jgi:N-acetylglucosaminylphosphatidylinositol deacetylase
MDIKSFYSNPSIIHQNFNHILLVIAHPDDEVMFFSPLLNFAVANAYKMSLLCISNGNFEGLGETRSKELIKSAAMHNIIYEDVHIIDIPTLQDGMNNSWPIDIVASKVVEVSRKIFPSLIVTFDERGASHHPNHIATYHGVKTALSQLKSEQPKNGLMGLKLVTNTIFRKFFGPVDLLLAIFCNNAHIIVFSWSIIKAIKWMYAHKSQNYMYRQVFIVLSSMTYVNCFADII